MAFPQDVNYIINKLRDSYLRANENDMSKRIMKPFLKQSQYYNVYHSNQDIINSESNRFDTMNLNILNENKNYIDNLRSNAESPPIQSNFYQNIKNRGKKYSSSSDSDVESDGASQNISPGSIKGTKLNTQSKSQKHPISLQSEKNSIFDVHDSSSRRSSGESIITNNDLEKQRKPELSHRISNIKEENEDEENDNPQTFSVSTITPNAFKNSNGNSNVNNNKFQNFKKNTYRSSIGKFFTKSTAQKQRDDNDDSDSSDDDEESLMDNEGVSNLDTGISSAQRDGMTQELIVDDRDETDIANEDEDLINIDHDDDDQENNSFDSLSDDDSLIGGSFTDDDDGADSVMDVAFKRATIYWKLNKDDLTVSDKLGTNEIQNDSVLSIGVSVNSQAFDTSDGSYPLEAATRHTEESKKATKRTFANPPNATYARKQRSNSESQEAQPHFRSKLTQLNRSVPNSSIKLSKAHPDIQEESLLTFKKVDVNANDEIAPKTSKLSSMLNEKKKKANASPLERYDIVSGENLANRVASSINVYIPDSKKYSSTPLRIKVKKGSKVIDLLGFILLKYTTLEKAETNGDKKYLDLNNWKLQLSDEGEVFDEGFGILDRTKTIDIYQPDEVSLIQVDEGSAKANEKSTPLPYTLDNESKASISANGPSSENNNGMGNSLSKTLTLNNVSHNLLLQSTISSPTSTLLARRLSKFNASEASLPAEKPIQVRVFLYPNNDEYSKIWFKTGEKVNDIIAKYCASKDLNPALYGAQILNEPFMLNGNEYISGIDGNQDIQIIHLDIAKSLGIKTRLTRSASTSVSHLPEKMKVSTKGFEPPQRVNSGSLSAGLGGFFPPRVVHSPTSGSRKSSGKLSSSLTRTKNRLKHGAKSTTIDMMPAPLSGLRLKRYPVWRRQQVNFMSRHERVFTIDGEYIYISSPESAHKSRSSKTSSFHISQVVAAKLSRKYPINFKIIIRRKNSSELKRYDFEGFSQNISTDIIRDLHNLKETYKMNSKH